MLAFSFPRRRAVFSIQRARFGFARYRLSLIILLFLFLYEEYEVEAEKSELVGGRIM